ncbi:[FeFe] hydrogenase H-cluster maturation GTPase HydF [Aminipila sp.]|uniref:[FeFe] hydrogenase H-cluster maturation GTPase HydF n=1 Tax=Aminipila sp. TaxID=2060095 RepID=UPI002F3FC5A1
MMSLNDTPRANRLHIGLFGKRNSGKSSLINALTGQEIAIVSPYAGTTADPVFKSMELHPIGPVVFIDTAGFDDEGELGKLRVEKTKEAVKKTDIAILLFTDTDLEKEKLWYKDLKKQNVPVIGIINKSDVLENIEEIKEAVQKNFDIMPEIVSAVDKYGMDRVRNALVRNIPEDYEMKSITGEFAKEGDVVLLVMPQDIQAPKGRLILPQVQTIRDLLDNSCIPICTTADKLDSALNALKNPPKLIITDSQCFAIVQEKKPEESLLTSFSVLFAAYKGDIEAFQEGAQAVDHLNGNSKVLIAEACTHAPLAEDIGRVKIPRMLKQRFGEKLSVEVVAGIDFPKDLSQYDLIVHCGACMFNRRYMMSRIESAKAQGVPITNYGVILAKLTGILDKVMI